MTKVTLKVCPPIGSLKKIVELSFDSGCKISDILDKSFKENLISNVDNYFLYCPEGASRKWFENSKCIEDYHISDEVCKSSVDFNYWIYLWFLVDHPSVKKIPVNGCKSYNWESFFPPEIGDGSIQTILIFFAFCSKNIQN